MTQPPSIPIIVYAVMAQVSVGRMFLAGFLPGLVIGLCLMVTVWIVSRRRGYGREPPADLRAVLRAGLDAGVAMLAPVIIVGGILGGAFTPTEAGAVAALYSFLVGKLVLRELPWSEVWQAILRAAEGTATALVILGASSVFAWIVADLQINRAIAALIFEISREPWVVLLIINIVLLGVGMFMDPLSAMVILVPILLPTVLEIGIDPIHFGIVVVMNLMIGLCTPPVGFLIFLSANIAGAKPEEVVRESVPFVAALLVALLICTYVPAVTLTLPGLMD